MRYYAGMDLEKIHADAGITSPPFRIRSVDSTGIFVYPYWKLSNGYIHYGMVQHVLFEEIESIYGMKPVKTEFSILA